MRKKFIILLLFVISFCIFILFKYNYNLFVITPTNEEAVDKINSLYSYEYFNPVSQEFYYGDDMHFMNSIYYKVILDFDEYVKYKNIYPNIINMTNKDFESNFLVLTITENESTKNLGLESITTDETTLYIGLNKKTITEEPKLDRGISIKIDKSLLRKKFDVFKTIRNTKFMNTYDDIKTLAIDYSIEDAIKDNCFVISTTPAKNINSFKIFLEKSQSNQDAEIRIVNNDSILNSIIIYDLKYSSSENKYFVCVDNSRTIYTNYDSSPTLSDTYNYYEYDILEKVDNMQNSESLNMYILKNNIFKENTFTFSFHE